MRKEWLNSAEIINVYKHPTDKRFRKGTIQRDGNFWIKFIKKNHVLHKFKKMHGLQK